MSVSKTSETAFWLAAIVAIVLVVPRLVTLVAWHMDADRRAKIRLIEAEKAAPYEGRRM